jgi:capsid protein
MTTLADEVAQQGRDWEEVLEQAAREEAKMEELGLTFGGGNNQPVNTTEDGNAGDEE